MSHIHPHTKALAELLAAVAPITPRHSGLCLDTSQKHWHVTEESCQCNQDAKRFYRATRDARASLDYDTPPATNNNAQLRDVLARLLTACHHVGQELHIRGGTGPKTEHMDELIQEAKTLLQR